MIDEGVVPIVHEPADDAEPGTPGIDAAVEVLDRREFGTGLVVEVVADVVVQPSGQKDRVAAVGALDAEAGGAGFQDMNPGCRCFWQARRFPSDDDFRFSRTSCCWRLTGPRRRRCGDDGRTRLPR